MKFIRVEDAVGKILFHDLTQIIPKESKGPRFKKGHIIKEEDVPVLLSMGKEHIYVESLEEGMIHEEEAAKMLADVLCGEGLYKTDPSEGKIDICASYNGLLKVDVEILNKINEIEDLMMATKLNNSYIEKDGKVAGTRVIPLIINKEIVEKACNIASDKKILNLMPFIKKKVAIITTGSEVLKGRIKDGFTPVILEKIKAYDMEVIYRSMPGDDKEEIAKHIKEAISMGAEVIFCTGGMSVDPDDNTPGAIKSVANRVVRYGTPVLPGAMFMLAYYNDVAIMGLPGSVMFARETVFDKILPRVAAGDSVTSNHISAMGHGGLL